MKKVPLNKIFNISYGNSFDLNVLEICDENFSKRVNYVSRTRENNGISATVKRHKDIKPFSPGLITVAGSGNSVLESFIQPEEFYTGYHVFILDPINEMSDIEKLFYCYCIRQNQYKYNFGRQANRTLKDILVPEDVPVEFQKISLKTLVPISNEKLINGEVNLDINSWKYFTVESLFKIEKGREVINKCTEGKVPLVSATGQNNGIGSFVNGQKKFDGNLITVAMNGASTGEAFYQENPFYATSDVNILIPKFNLNVYIALFICSIFRMEKYRFNYGRKWSKERMEKDRILLPAKNEKPDFMYMEQYIKKIPFSVSI